MTTCQFCNASVNIIFHCKKCNRDFCFEHRQPMNHNCNEKIDKKESKLTSTLSETNKDKALTSQITTNKYYYPANGEITLDINMISSSINKLIKSYINLDENITQHKELVLRKFIISNPKGRILIRRMRPMLKHRLIEGVWNWLSIFGNPLKQLKKLSDNYQIPLDKLSLQKIIECYYSTLTDFSSSNQSMVGFEKITQVGFHSKMTNKKHFDIKTKGYLVFSNKILTEISEHARQSGDRECSGYLIGKRNSDNSIKEITRYKPLSVGGEMITAQNYKNLIKIMIELEEVEDKIIGFVHSHPYKSVPIYSPGDELSHLRLTATLSIFEYLSLNTNFNWNEMLHLAAFLRKFDIYQIEFLLKAINISIPYTTVFKEVMSVIVQQNPDTWSSIKNQIDIIYNKYQLKPDPIDFQLIPQAGVVICPWIRQIGIIDCIYEHNPQDPNLPVIDWFYYRVAIKKE
ncbi:MAG: Mov34/MPN/PAD-1 family protein [Candidatus Helarchaeota archaeon]|nr:Mov34/MPN/PAD-1 family protein [Candidatus Helarchaeota archaeon]